MAMMYFEAGGYCAYLPATQEWAPVMARIMWIALMAANQTTKPGGLG